MVTYDNLPVYKASYDLLLEIFMYVRWFKKEFKYSLWNEVKNEMLYLIKNIYKANSTFEKRKYYISLSRESVETIRLYIRLCKDLHLLGLEKFVKLNEKIEIISKQLTSWYKSCK